jgi:quercetin dioxygenase-like cupin family protein
MLLDKNLVYIGDVVPIYQASDSEPFEAHGSRFQSYLRTGRGASTLCAWRLEVAPGLEGVLHRPSHEEVLLMLEGQLRVTLDGTTTNVSTGAVVHVPAGAEFKVDGGPEGAAAWVTTTAGLSATLADGTQLAPPWAQ